MLSKQQIRPQTNTSVDPQQGLSAAKNLMPNPANFTDSALQTESHFIADAMQDDGGVSENPIAPFYEAYQDTLTSSLDALNAASLFSLQNRAQRVAAQPVQQQNRSGFVGRVARAGSLKCRQQYSI